MGTVTIEETVYQVYGTLADADAYLKGRLAYRSIWLEAAQVSDDERKLALVQAADLLNRQRWKGTPTAPYVPGTNLQWPRDGASDADGTAVPNGTTPKQIEHASYEIAAILLDDPDGLRKDSASVNLQAVQAGSAKVTFFSKQLIGRFPRDLMELFSGYMVGGSVTAEGVGEAFGTDGESQFDDADLFGTA